MKAPDFTSFGFIIKPAPRQRGWFYGPVTDDIERAKELAARLRPSAIGQGYGVLVGLRDNDKGHRIYITPVLPARELVEAFSVGGEDGGEPMVTRMAERLATIERICPLVVTFADSRAGTRSSRSTCTKRQPRALKRSGQKMTCPTMAWRAISRCGRATDRSWSPHW